MKKYIKNKEIRHRVLYVTMVIVIVRAMSQIPVPGVDTDFFKSYFGNTDAFSLLDAFAGGSFENFSVMALGITPYITSSIIIQLMTIAVPSLEQLQKDGEAGRKKIQKLTQYITAILSIAESVALCIGYHNQMLLETTPVNIVTVIFSMTAGSCILVWLGGQATEKGLGNGITLILSANIVSRIPSDLRSLYSQFASGKPAAQKVLACAIIAVIIVGIIIMTVVLNGAERKIPVQYSQKMNETLALEGEESSIPLKVNTGNVMPVIFAASVMALPSMVAGLLGKSPDGWAGKIISAMSSGNWFNPDDWILTVGYAVYAFLLIFFAYYYTQITFNSAEIADNLKKSGAVIPGIRSGKPTENYLNGILKYIVMIGALGLLIVCTVPIVLNGVLDTGLSFGGTSLIIVISAVTEMFTQAKSIAVSDEGKLFLR